MTFVQLLWRVPLAVLGGGLGLWLFPTEGIWILAPVSVALIVASVVGTGFWLGALLGFISGQAFYISHIEWISLYLGPVPLIALTTLQSLFFAVGMGAIALTWRKLFNGKSNFSQLWLALAVACLWTAREWLANNFPYGGFPWSRMAMTQSESILSRYAWLGGMSLVSFVVALIGVLLLLAIIKYRRSKQYLFPAVATIPLLFLVPLVFPLGNTDLTGEIKIAAVQGNANAGLFANPEKGSILKNHVEATKLMTPGQKADLDLIVWPENASDIDPLRSETANQIVSDYVAEYQAPLAFGTLTRRGEESYNSTLLWDATGPVDYYDKTRPVPFAEYVPDREFWRLFAPDLIDLVPKGYSFGVRDGVFDIPEATLGTLICFEIAADDIPRDLAANGAEIILSQTNNADFGMSDQTYQQVAIAKLRAIETGRTVVNISTVGKSAIYAPDGKLMSELDWYEPGVMVQTVELRSGNTPAVAIGFWLEMFNLVVAAGIAVFSTRTKRRRPRGRLRGSGRRRSR